ncbi:nitroreductase/quinone reductase family protein [Couchioplanes caeruleus]|uniref:nitroreductase/quinone reductase family protein n=1 Tax=Couchioplanes caeruleus TaxID=56438 RepID=UPI00201BB526|nr:nitroreductase/quinone reductase family protein [Couchioplanes caeruleus]UQU61778.1 nitroreductase/quinone reductase family protein [Couchioplanes caeruleus]
MTLMTPRMARRLYRGGRPNRLARGMNRLSAVLFAHGVLTPPRAVTLEVRGRTSGRTVSLPLVAADLRGERYLVSMLGEDAGWVRNVRAAGGHAVLLRRGREDVLLVEVPAAQRAPVLQRYLHLAPGARPHIPLDRHAPLADFAGIAARYPVFRIVAAPPVGAAATGSATPQ